MRAAGILLPIFSIPSKYGIGSFSKEAYEFVDSLEKSGQTYWQILPLGQTGYWASPYQSYSTFAGNPYFIDLEQLIKDGLLTKDECDSYDFGSDENKVDYDKINIAKEKLLRKAYEKSDIKNNSQFNEFCKENDYWLDDFALYFAVKQYFDGKSWIEWDEDIRDRKKDAMIHYKDMLDKEIFYYKFVQYEFCVQWFKLKKYANNKNIKIFGDIPIYVAFDSADCWSDTKLFQFDENNNPKSVAGCPPDAFSKTGQMWGNPLYDWDYHKSTGYGWWIRRFDYCFKLFDIVRVDHFRGFDEYYSIPYGQETAVNGEWKKGPGIEFFNMLTGWFGKMNIIAEDLGILTDSVRQLLKDTGYPGMKILEFAFDNSECSSYLPQFYDSNCVVYTGTHDNNTLIGWYDEMSDEEKNFTERYLNNKGHNKKEVTRDFIRLALSSVADMAIIPMQDYLALGEEARINEPSTVGKNWKWRMSKDAFSNELQSEIKTLTRLFSRG